MSDYDFEGTQILARAAAAQCPRLMEARGSKTKISDTNLWELKATCDDQCIVNIFSKTGCNEEMIADVVLAIEHKP